MRLAFMGTPDFSTHALHALKEAEHDIVSVYTQPPRPAGRGKAPRKSPVHETAEKLGLNILTPEKLKKNAEAIQAFKALDLDAAVVVAYGLILPTEIIHAPKFGCINIHASLLPRWRGAAPIQRAIMAGDKQSGISIMQMDEGLDTGPVYLMKSIPLLEGETAATLHDKLAIMGAKEVVSVLKDIEKGTVHALPQPNEGATYAKKIDKAEAQLDWSEPAAIIDRKVRALNPFPGAYTFIGGDRVKILAGTIEEKDGPSGIVLDDKLLIGCGNKAYRITKLQKSGRAAMKADDFLRGQTIPADTQLG